MEETQIQRKRVFVRFRIATLLWLVLATATFFAGRRWDDITRYVQLETAFKGKQVTLAIGKSTTVTSKVALPRIQVNAPEILQVQALSPRQIKFVGRKRGTTTVTMWPANGRPVTYTVTVR